jgi:hypothetical protein
MLSKTLFNAALAQARDRCIAERETMRVFVGRREAGGPWTVWVCTHAEGRPPAPAVASEAVAMLPSDDGTPRTLWCGILNETVEA